MENWLAKNLFAGVVRGWPDKDSLLGLLWEEMGRGATHDPRYADAVEGDQTKSPIKWTRPSLNDLPANKSNIELKRKRYNYSEQDIEKDVITASSDYRWILRLYKSSQMLVFLICKRVDKKCVGPWAGFCPWEGKWRLDSAINSQLQSRQVAINIRYNG